MSLLPSSYDSAQADDAEPRVVDVESDEADEVFAALSSGTARKLLKRLHDAPAPPAELADSVDTSVQNVQYHLENLKDAGAIEVVDTAYSEKGREMDVYAPADQPLVIFAGDEDESSTLKTAISRLLGSLGVLAFASALVQALYGEFPFGDGGSAGDGADDGPADEGTDQMGDGEAPETADGADRAVDDGADGAMDGGADGFEEEAPAPAEDSDAAGDVPEDGVDVGQEFTGNVSDGLENVSEIDIVDGSLDLSDGTLAIADGSGNVSGQSVNVTDVALNVSDGLANAPVDQPPASEPGTTAGAAATLPPGVVFFLGGVFALCLVVAVLYVRGFR